jgi:hypothetical protein
MIIRLALALTAATLLAFSAGFGLLDSRGREVTVLTADQDIYPDPTGGYTVRFLSPADLDLASVCLYRMDTGALHDCIPVSEPNLRVTWGPAKFDILGTLTAPIRFRARAVDTSGNESVNSLYAAVLHPTAAPGDTTPPAPPQLITSP